MKILPQSTPVPENKPAEKIEDRPKTATSFSLASSGPRSSPPAEPRELKPPTQVDPGPSELDKISSRFELEFKKQIAVMHRSLAQDMEELTRHQQKLEEKEDRQVQTTLDHIKQNYEAEFMTSEKKWEAERAHWMEQLNQRERLIDKLSREMAAMKKLVELRPPSDSPAVRTDPAPRPAVVPLTVPEPAAPKAVAETVPREEKPVAALPSQPPILPDERMPPGKTSGFFSRAWEYLNGTAIEIPIKSNRKE